MTKVIKSVCFLLLIGFGTQSHIFAQNSGSQELQNKIDEYLNPFLNYHDLNGVLLIAQNDKILLKNSYGYANFELGVKNTTSTKFNIASLSKTFTAAAIMILENKGKLKIEDKLSKYIPSFPRGDEISIEMLLRHQSGVKEEHSFESYWENISKPVTLGELSSRIGNNDLGFDPGTDNSYSNSGYAILAYLVEVVTQKTFEEFLNDEVFSVLKLNDTNTNWGTNIIEGLASGYIPGPEPYYVLKYNSFGDLTHDRGSGGLYSTAEDLLKWAKAIANDKFFELESYNYPFGWGLRERFGRKALVQSGIIGGYVSNMVIYPDDELYLIFLNNVRSGVAFQNVTDDITAGIFNKKYEIPEFHHIEYSLTKNSANYEATFELEGVGKYDIEIIDDDLYMVWHDFPLRSYLQPVSKDRFFNRMDNAVFKFEFDQEGEVRAVVWEIGENMVTTKRVIE